MSSALNRITLAGNRVRGLEDESQLQDVSPAVVLVLGGAGVQTISRLKSAVIADRPDQSALSSVRILGIDAVDSNDQHPPLPPGVGLDVGEFFNLVATPFDASRYIHGQLPTDTYLQKWWDPDYRPPMGPLTEGLKRERMLGRLAFHRVSQELVDRIQSTMSAAIRIQEGRPSDPDDIPTIPVYIVCSGSGGTGSSGFLETVFACWRAAQSAGYFPQIRAFVYLPSVFRNAVLKTPGGGVANQAQDANAFAFFREIDHFARRSSHLGRYFGMPESEGGPEIPDGELLHQVYIVDNVLRGKGEIDSITDMYEIVSEALFHFLLTDVGMPLVGVNATNTDRALAELDRFDKPRRYCGLGIARVVFPGDTYRHHLTMRYIDWFIRGALLSNPVDLPGMVRDHEVVEQLNQALDAVDVKARHIEQDDDIADFLDLADQGIDEMERVSDPSQASDLMTRVRRAAPRVVRSVEESAATRNRVLLADLEDTIEDIAFTSGHGLPFAREAMKIVSKRASSLHAGSRDEAELTSSGMVDAEEKANKLYKELVAASHRGMFPKAAAVVASWIGKGRTQEEIARELGQSIQSWAQAIYDSEVAAARESLLEVISKKVQKMRLELERAEELLHVITTDARTRWEADELLGKDAGPLSTTSLIPEDVIPEIEDSSLAVSLFDDIVRDHGTKLVGPPVSEFISRWSTEEANRAFFSLGAANESERSAAEESLVQALARDAASRALVVGDGEDRRPRLPLDLPEASEANPDLLTQALQALVARSKTVCWSWEEGHFQLADAGDGQRDQAVKPTTTTVIARSPALGSKVKELAGDQSGIVDMPDGERVVALSCEWAVPIHALHRMGQWQTRYDQLYRKRSHKPGHVPPNHIDRRFVAELDPLVPQYFQSEDIGEVLGKAFVFGELLSSEHPTVVRSFDATHARPAVQPIRMDDSHRFQGRVVRIVDERLSSDADDTDLGDSWQTLFDMVGSDARLRTTINDLGSWMVRNVGPAELESSVASYIEDRLQPLMKAKDAKPAEVAVLAYIFEGLGRWLVDLKEIAAASGL